MAYQQAFEIRTRGRAATEITEQVARRVRASGIATGAAHVFVQHTSCWVLIIENADAPSIVIASSLLRSIVHPRCGALEYTDQCRSAGAILRTVAQGLGTIGQRLKTLD